jgi:catalase-peroxidase
VADQAEIRPQYFWADLIVLTGNVALESMGFKTFGFSGGRPDVWEPDEDVYWGSEREWLGGDSRYGKDKWPCRNPVTARSWPTRSARQRGKPHRSGRAQPGKPARRRADGPDLRQPGRPGRQARPGRLGRDIRETFGRMAMNDEETVALIAGGHAFGKTHGAGPADNVGPSRSGRPGRTGPGLAQRFGTGKGADTITSGLEVTWTTTPTQWSNNYLENLFGFEWELTKSPAARTSGSQKRRGRRHRSRCPRSEQKRPTMLTSDLALRFDPIYEPIARRFLANLGRWPAPSLAHSFKAEPPRHVHRLRQLRSPATAARRRPMPGRCGPAFAHDGHRAQQKALASTSAWCPSPLRLFAEVGKRTGARCTGLHRSEGIPT